MHLSASRFLSITAILFTAAICQNARAAELVTNGNFELTSNGAGQMGFNTNATGWTTTGYNFLFAPGTADSTGATGKYGNLKLWGPASADGGSANGLTAASPAGGNYVAADGAFEVQPIFQTINGLTPGGFYAVSFWWAAAQQYGYDGATTEKWVVSLGSQSISTSVYELPNHGFSGWKQETMTFTATSSSSVLSFLAVGTPNGLPPFSLLDGVSMNAVSVVPEPSTFFAGALLIGGAMLRRYRKSARA